MALQLLESFNDGAFGLRLSGLNPSAVGPSYGKDGNGARLGDTSGYNFSIAVSNPCVIGFNFKVVTEPGEQMLFTFGGTTNEYCVLFYDGTGQRLHFQFYNGAVNYQHAYSANGSVTLGVWHFIEMRIFQNTSTASTLGWALDGSPLTSITNGDMPTTYGTVQFGYTTSSWVDDWYIDNLYVCDTTGGVNDDLLGPIRVDDLYPNGVGTYSNMARSAGSVNYELVDENPPNDDTDYVYSTTEGDLDTYQMNDTTSADEAIAGVIANVVSRKTGGGPKFLRPLARIGGVDYTGTSGGLTESYGLVTEVWDVSPATATTWGTTEIDGMEIGQEVRDS